MEHILVIPDDLFEKIERFSITEEEIDKICLRALESSLKSKKKRRKKQRTYMIDDVEFVIKKVSKDGHCFFSVIELYTDYSVEDIRERISDFMLRNKNTFINSYEEDEHDGDSYEEFIEDIRSTNEWGDHLVIQATQLMLDRPIKIFEKDISNELIQRPGATDDSIKNDPIYMVYNGENHYDALIQKSEDYVSKPVIKSEKMRMANGETIDLHLGYDKSDEEIINDPIFIVEDEKNLLTKEELQSLKKDDIKELLEEKNISYKSSDKKSILIRKYLEDIKKSEKSKRYDELLTYKVSELKDLMDEKDIDYQSKDKKSVLIKKILDSE